MDSQLLRLNQMSYQHQKQFLSHQRAAAAAATAAAVAAATTTTTTTAASPGGHQALSLIANQPAASQRQHYSTRQQASQLAPAQAGKQQQQQQLQLQLQQRRQFAASQSASSGSDQDEQAQLSSLSTATTSKSNSSSQAAILASQSLRTSNQMQREQQHHQQMLRQQQQQQQRHPQNGPLASGHHRQAALQAHTLATLPSSKQQQQQQQQLLLSSSHHKTIHQQAGNHANNLASSDQLTTSSDQTIDDLHHLAPHQHHHQGRRRMAAAASAKEARRSQPGGRFLLGVLFTLAELLLFATVFLWLYWAYQHDDGLAWQSDRKQQFNTHAALMLFGFVFLSGQAMLIHRSFACCSKIYTKILHTILFVLASSAISLGLILAYTAQENVGSNSKPIMHFYSLHAWCGLASVALFVLQFVFGFVSFLILLCCERATAGYRAALLPIHKTFGLIIFSLAIATCLTGLLQTARSRLSSKLNKSDYHELAEPGILINLIGVCLICLAILMPYIIRNLDIERPVASFKAEFDRHLNKLSQLEMRI